MKNSNFLSLNWLDIGKGLLMAILTNYVDNQFVATREKNEYKIEKTK